MKRIDNDYRLENGNRALTPGEIREAFSHFEYFMANCQQIVNKDRQLVPFKLNEFQRRLFSTILPLVHKNTRTDKRHSVIVVKSRQVGASVGVTALINYLCAFADLQNINIAHVFPVGDTITKFYQQKVQPIISGVHPSIYPNMEKETLTSSIMTHYKDIKGIPLHNYYELISSGSDSIRSSTIQILLEDECLSGDVEILTDKGFRRLDSLDKTERVAQYDPTNDGISFVKPLRYINREYDGDAYEWEVAGAKFISTSRHSFMVGRNEAKWSTTGTKYKRLEAFHDFVNQNYMYPTWGVGVAEHEPLTSLERLGIATQADGSVIGERKRMGKNATAKGWTKCQMSLKRKSKIARMRRLLEDAEITYNESVDGRGYSVFSYDLPYSNPKLLPSFLNVNCSYERAREIIHEVLHWDGYGLDRDKLSGKIYLPKDSHYSSIIKENRDFVAAIALQAGQQVTASVQKDGRSETHSDVYRLNMHSRRNKTYESFSRTPIDYKGRVYCVEVPTGAIVIKTGREVWVCGNCCYYKRPEKLESAVLPSLPDTGFSLLVYLSTVGEDASSMFFLEKLKIALDNPEDWTIIFVPWFFTYPERKIGVEYDSLILDEYESETLIPAFIKEGLPKERWGDCISWYRKRLRDFNNNRKRMQLEYPSTLNEVMTINSDKCVFQKESLDAQEKNIMPGTPMRMVTDNATGKVEAQETDISPFTMYKRPLPGHRYRITIDPIVVTGEDTDFFTMVVWDLANNEQVATFHERGLQDEDYADWAVSIGTIYNKAELCPESNVASAFVIAVNSRRYYRWVYQTKKNKLDKIPGIRTTVSSKELMIDRLNTLLDRGNIIIHSEMNLQELRDFVKVVKVRADGSRHVRMMAKGKKHDDFVACGWVLAGSLDQRQLEGRRKSGFAIL